MEYISATDARDNFASIINQAQKEPVIIQRQNRDVAVMISPEEFDKLRRIKIEELDRICERASAYAKAQGLTEEKLSQLLADES